jgi:hypothetical protein
VLRAEILQTIDSSRRLLLYSAFFFVVLEEEKLPKGVEIGQLLALGAILIAMGYWRRTNSFLRHAYTANVIMMIAGFILIGYQLTGYFVS